jgi:hypothetical protein
MKMTLEEKLNKDTLFVLERIKKELLLGNTTGNFIEYNLTVYPSRPNAPSIVDEQQIIELLKKRKIVTEIKKGHDFSIVDPDSNNPKLAGITLYLSIKEDVFNDYYEQIKKAVYGTTQNKLSISTDGNISYSSTEGTIYTGTLGTKTNGYNVLLALASKPHKILSFGELAKHLKDTNDDSSDNERRVRDSIQTIKNAINYSGKDLFKVDYGFGLNCSAEIIG